MGGYKVIEAPSGIGKVFRGQTPVATVRYSLEITPAMPRQRRSRTARVGDACDDITGRLEILSGSLRDAYKEPGLLVLELEDGRQLPFYPAEIRSTVSIVGVGVCR